MNTTEKRYNNSKKIHLNDVIALIFFFEHIWYFGVVTSYKILFSCISTSSLSCAKNSFLK